MSSSAINKNPFLCMFSIREKIYRKFVCNSWISSRRRRAISRISNNPSSGSFNSLFEVLGDGDPVIRKLAAESLLLHGNDKTVGKLLFYLEHGEPDARTTIATSMLVALTDVNNLKYENVRSSLSGTNFEYAKRIFSEENIQENALWRARNAEEIGPLYYNLWLLISILYKNRIEDIGNV